MLLGNLSAFLLAPLFASSMFANFGMWGGHAAASTTFDTDRWNASSSEERSSLFDDWGSRYWRDPAITDIKPADGAVGTEVTLTGNRFGEDSVVRFGEGVINDVEVSKNGRSLSFTVPESMGRYCPPDQFCTQIAYEVTPGEYDVRVVSNDRTSDAVAFTVTADDGDTDGDEGLSIESIDGPTSLAAGTEGSWNVAVSGASSTLRYSVVWGDENRGLRALLQGSDATEQASATFTHTYQDPGTYTPEFTVRDATGAEVTKQAATVTVAEDGTIRIDAIEPAEARSGDTVALSGVGFDGDTKVYVGRTEAANVQVASDTSLTFTVPELAARSYRVSVTSDEGRSNAIALKVAPALKTRVSVLGVDAPIRLNTDEDGTWTVHAATNAQGNLRYSVVWGDEGMNAMRRTASSDMAQASATFTHRYAAAGTYHPKFTVTDGDGNTASVSASVVVKTGG